MPVSATLLISGVRASIKVYAAGDKALSRYLRDRDMVLPNATGPYGTSAPNELLNELEADADQTHPDYDRLESDLNGLIDVWIDLSAPEQAARLAILQDAVYSLVQQNEQPGLTSEAANVLSAEFRISQWGDQAGPNQLLPWQEFAVALGQVTFEFVGSNASLLQLGGDTERLVGAFSTTISDMVDDAAFQEETFGADVLSVVLRAGLQTLSDERALIFDEKHVQKLVEKTVAPVIDVLKDPALSNTDRRKFKAIVSDLIGPVSQAAFGVLADHQEAFLGDDSFGTEELLGKLVNSLFVAAKDGDFHTLLTASDAATLKAAGVRVFKLLAKVAAENPGLIVKGDGDIDTFLKDFLNRAATLVAGTQNIDNDLGLEIVAAGLDALAANTPALVKLGPNTDAAGWENVVEKSIQQVLANLSAATTADKKLDALLTKAQIIDLSRVFFAQVATTPNMVTGNHAELNSVVKAVSEAMVKHDLATMTADDWLHIGSVAVREAGRNPGRLFRQIDSTGNSLGNQLLSELMSATADAMTLGTDGGNVLFGETLRIATETALRAASDNHAGIAQALSGQPGVRNLAGQISINVEQQKDGRFLYGAKEWLALWRLQLPLLLAEGTAFKPLAEVLLPDLQNPLRGQPTPHGAEQVRRALKPAAQPGA